MRAKMAKPHPNNIQTFHVISPFGGPSKDEALPASDAWLCRGRTLTTTGMPERLTLILQYFYRGCAKITVLKQLLL